jgi:hypothetical protein
MMDVIKAPALIGDLRAEVLLDLIGLTLAGSVFALPDRIASVHQSD